MPSRQTDKNTTQTRIFKYGLAPISCLPQATIDELSRCNKLWNRLVEINNEHWQILEQVRKDACPSYAKITAKVDKITAKINNAYTHRRGQRGDAGSTKGDDFKTKITELKRQRSDLWSEVRDARKTANTFIDFKPLNKNLNDAFNEAVRVQQSGVMRNTGDEIRRNFDNARERLVKKPGSGRLRFHPFDSTGYWQYRFRAKGGHVNGVGFEELFEGNTPSKKDFVFIGRDDSRKKPRLRLRAKLASGVDVASRIYQEFDLILHRPIPADAQIQSGKIIRTRTGDKFRYDLVLVVKLPRQDNLPVPHDNALGLHINSRHNMSDTEKSGIEVMTISSLDGQILDTINVPIQLLKALDYINNTKSDLDKSATDLGNTIKPLLEEMPFREKLLPQDVDRLDDVARNQYHFERLCASIVDASANMTLPFETAYKLATDLDRHPNMLSEEVTHHIIYWWKEYGWRYRELHNLRAKQLRNRNDLYRQAAARIISYGLLICFEKKALANITKGASSPGILAIAIKSAAEREGIPWVDVSTTNISKKCPACGKVNKILPDEKTWDCPSCNETHDRDETAAMDIARLGLEKYNEAHDK